MASRLVVSKMDYPGKREDLKCGECGALMVLRKSPKFPKPFYGCSRFPECRGTHGAHPNGSPLGVPASKEVKEWRIKAHDAFDTLWKCGGINMTRKKAYQLLTQEMGESKQVHIGELDIEGCNRVIVASEKLLKLRSNK